MLQPEHLDIVESTAPVLAQRGEDITRHFYRELLEQNPAVAPMFSPAHQRGGTQQRALADAIVAFASNVRQLEALAPAVERIGHKHAALGVQPEHYPIVGKHLLEAIRAVLGEAATDAVLDAWAAAYGVLADVLTGRETQLYADQQQIYGWNGFRELVVVEKTPESDCITSFHLAATDGQPLPAGRPGQYLTLRLPTPEGSTTLRNYSLSAWDDSGLFRISVKSELAPSADLPTGFGSNYLHDHVQPGARLEVAPPSGDFVLPPAGADAPPLVLIAGGVGVTPLLAMLQFAAAEQTHREILFVHGARTRSAQAFEAELRGLAQLHGKARVHVRLSDDPDAPCDSNGFVDANLLRELLAGPDCDVYLCGPQPFMTAVHAALVELGVAAERIHSESFGPAEPFHAAG